MTSCKENPSFGISITFAGSQSTTIGIFLHSFSTDFEEVEVTLLVDLEREVLFSSFDVFLDLADVVVVEDSFALVLLDFL